MNHDESSKRFRELVDRGHSRWAGIARAYAEPSDVDDLQQEIALQVWKSLGRFGGRSSIDTWAYRIALNTAITWRRSDTRKTPAASSNVEQVAARSLPAKDAQHVLDEFLPSLPKADRATMLLYLDGVPSAEAAEILGISEGAVRVRMHRIRKRFEAAYLEQDEPYVV